MRLIGFLTVSFALGCSDTGGTASPPHTNNGGISGGGTTAVAGAASSNGGAASGGSSGGRGGVVAGGGGSLPNAGTTQNGGASMVGGAGGSSGSGGRAQGGGSGVSDGPPGGRGGASGRAGDAGGSSAARGGATGAGGMEASGGSGGNIDTKNVTTTCPGAVPGDIKSTWCSCEQWGEKVAGNSTYYNDVWGSGPGPQCIWLADGGMWGVASTHPNTSGIKSYPNVSLSPHKAISSINTYTSSFDLLVPSGGAYETAYDLWVKGTTSARIEIMLWMTYQGGVNPIAKAYDSSGAVPDETNVTVGGHTWNVFYGSNGANDVASFVRTTPASSGSVDIKAILSWLIANNHSSYAVFTAGYTLDQVQFGHEISSDSGTQAYVTRSFSVSSSGE
jgi:hypothetical protein